MVYYLCWRQNELPSLPEYWQKYLPPERIEKALSFKQEKDRITSVYAFLLLRYALFREFGIVAMPKIETDANGKPFEVKNEYHFNLSHCETAVACAIDSAFVGVDVQEFRSVKDNVIRKVCSQNEQMLLQKTDRHDQLFAAFWASKEAYGKCKGTGIGYDLQNTCFCEKDAFPCMCKTENKIICTELKNGFALSVCAQHELQEMQISENLLHQFLQTL